MLKQIIPARVKGILRAPSSKSVAQRAIAVASLAKGISEIYYPGNCDDVLAAIDVCKRLGAGIEEKDDLLVIRGGIHTPVDPLDCGEAGLGIRMFSALAATLSEKVVLTGRGSLLKRPMDMIEQSLKSIGVECSTQDGFVPVTVQGPIPGGTARIDGSVSSQVLTGILIAAPLGLKPLQILVEDLKSRPYVDITIETMKAFGVEVVNKDYEMFTIPAPQVYASCCYAVEGDWSGASFLLVAGAIAGEIRVENLRKDSTQADRAILEALQKSGAVLRIEDNSVSVSKGELSAFEFDATHCPDLFPPLVALASNCKGITSIRGVSRLAVKESDRALTLKEEFGKLGVDIKLQGDLMLVEGSVIKGSDVHARHDHRIAMACAVAGLVADTRVTIDNAEAVGKSYPDFYDDLKAVSHYDD
jgi:3-phosphoshikimate 1-carboxyvinyltransferase